jgi:hypothetical protein
MTPEEKDALIRTIADPGAGGTHGREAAKAKLEAALATEVTAVIEHAQTVLGTRLTELATEIASTREAMNTSSGEITALTSALVRWTKVSVGVIAVYTLLTGVSVVLMGVLVWLQFSRPHP